MSALSSMIAAQKRAERIAAVTQKASSVPAEEAEQDAKEKRRQALKAYYANRTPEEAERVRQQRAATRHQRKADSAARTPIGRHEEHLAWRLRKLGLETTPQQKVGRFKIDLGAWPLAIEVVTAGARPETRYGQRIEYLMGEGWHVLYVVIRAGVRSSDTNEMKQRRRQTKTFSEWLPRQIVRFRDQVLEAEAPGFASCDSVGFVRSEGSLDGNGRLVVVRRARGETTIGSAGDRLQF